MTDKNTPLIKQLEELKNVQERHRIAQGAAIDTIISDLTFVSEHIGEKVDDPVTVEK